MNDPFTPKGKYTDDCDKVQEQLHADCVCLIVLNGPRGHGFAVNATDPVAVLKLPEILRSVADDIDEQQRKAQQQ